MSIRNREEAVQAALADKTNTPRYCQLVTRTWFNAPSAGDFDGDGAADAEDGWKREPAHARRYDRNPPRGVPVTWLGGSDDNGHRAISLGNGMIRSTDAGGAGKIATVPLAWVENNWGMAYAGWSTTINGYEIPLPPEAPAPKPKPPTLVSKARKKLVEALENARRNGQKGRAEAILKALKALPKR
jgi:hypothetical protein